MALDERGEGRLPGIADAGGEPFEQLAVGERADRAHMEERPQVRGQIQAVLDRHGTSDPDSRVEVPRDSPRNAEGGPERSRFLRLRTIFAHEAGISHHSPGNPETSL